MIENSGEWSGSRELFWKDVLLIFGAFVLSRIAIYLTQRLLVGLAEHAPARYRLSILRTMPFAKSRVVL